jgi:hypothetical protein
MIITDENNQSVVMQQQGASDDVVIIPINPSPMQQSAVEYLKGFDENELNGLKTLYGKSHEELDQFIASHPCIYWAARINYFIANYGSCALFLPFPIQTGNQGIITIAQLFKADVQVPSLVGYGIGGPLSFIQVVFFMFLFSARKEALKTTLWYALKQPWPAELNETIAYAKKNPLQVAYGVGDEVILRTYNVYSTVTELIYLPSIIPGINFSSPGMITFALGTLYFGNEYCRKYTDTDYNEGKKFWLNEEKREWLITKAIKEKNISTPLQVWLVGASTVGARAFLYYGIAVTAQKVLSNLWPFNWVAPEWVATTAFIHALRVRYPPIFNYYRKAEELLDRILLTTHSLEEISHIKQTYKQDLQKREGCFFLLKKEPAAVLLPLFGAFLGGYFGHGLAQQQLAKVMNSIIAEVFTIPIGAILLGKPLYNAERDRVVHNQHLLEVQQAHNEPPVVPSEEPSKGIVTVAIILNVSAAIVSVTSTIGASKGAVGTNSNSDINAVITLVAVQMGLGSLLLNHNKLVPTVKDFYNSLPSFKDIRDALPSCSRICPRFFKSLPPSLQVGPQVECRTVGQNQSSAAGC